MKESQHVPLRDATIFLILVLCFKVRRMQLALLTPIPAELIPDLGPYRNSP